MIRVYHPQVSVVVTKVVKRTGAARTVKANDRPIDLAPFLGEAGGVTVHRSLSGADGSFVVTLADRLDQETLDTMYARIEPMDHVEIRMSGEPHEHSALPIVMRGFVTSVRRTESMGGDGRPVRAVVISGHDYYKVLFNQQIFYRYEYVLGDDLLSRFQFIESTGINFPLMPASSFIKAVVEVLNGRLREMKLRTKLREPFVLNVRDSVKNGKISASTLAKYQGTLWGLMTEQADLAWNEMFFDDDEKGQWLVYRPLPWRDLAGKRCSQDPGAKDAVEVEIEIGDVVEMSLERADLDVTNYTSVQAPNAVLANREQMQVSFMQDGTYFPEGGAHPNADMSVYGLKKMEPASYLWDDRIQHKPDDASPVVKQQIGEYSVEWVKRRTQELWAAHKDNVVYERGSMKIRGNEAVKPGVSLRLKRGTREASYYVRAITHNFRPFHSFTTDVEVERGTGFIERFGAAASPYLAEMST